MLDKTFFCVQCKQTRDTPIGTGGTGYGYNDKEEKICYACCAENDKTAMREDGKIMLYLTYEREGRGRIKNGKLTNWPSSLEFPAGYIKQGHHNIAGSRYDTWFVFEGYRWHAVQYGEWTQIAHCKRTKEQVK